MKIKPAGERRDYRQKPFDWIVQPEKGFDEGELDFLEPGATYFQEEVAKRHKISSLAQE